MRQKLDEVSSQLNYIKQMNNLRARLTEGQSQSLKLDVRAPISQTGSAIHSQKFWRTQNPDIHSELSTHAN